MIANFTASALAPQIESTLFLATLVASWALLRPTMVRDYDNRRLPPSPTARLMFVVLCLFAYVALALCFLFFDSFATDISRNIPLLSSVVGQFKGQAPVLALFALIGLMQLSMVRDIERSLLAWLHSAGHLHQDGVMLASHLARCEFTPTEAEHRENRDMAKRFGIHVTGDINDVGFVTFPRWRKVATLVRVLRLWNADSQSSVLDDNDLKLLDEIETAHERKTQLAMTIVKLVERAESGDPSGRALTDMMSVLAKTRYADDSGVAEIEKRMREMMSAQTASAGQPLRLTGEEFRSYMSQIDGYFQAEYEILLQESAALAARSVVLSGDDAPDRLETLRSLGFAGLGRIEAININRSLFIFLLVAVGGFLVLLLGMQAGKDAPPADMLARFAFILALSSLVAAYTVSRRSLAGSSQTPWGAFVVAGLVAIAIHLSIHALFDLPKMLAAAEGVPAPIDPATGMPAEMVPLHRRVVWGALPFFLVLAICRLGRLDKWPLPSSSGIAGAMVERTLDAVALSVTMLLSFYLVVGAHLAFGVALPRRMQNLLNENGFYGLAHTAPALTLIALGAFIGFFVVRDVRRAVHARIIESQPAPEKIVVIPPRKALPAAA